MTLLRRRSTCWSYDKAREAYRSYTLLALSTKVAESDLKLFGAKTNQLASAVQQQSLQTAARKQDDYLSNRVQVYARETEKAQSSLSTGQYDKFVHARKWRQDGRSADAIAQLKELVRAKPGFYLGWFNLALAQDEQGDVAAATAAYERAIELESKGEVRDASLYNTYGYFLFKHSRYAEAITNLKMALSISADHPKARSTLAAAMAAINR